jgi:hypothetical protein
LRRYPSLEEEEKRLWKDIIPKIPKPLPEYIEEDDDPKKKKKK